MRPVSSFIQSRYFYWGQPEWGRHFSKIEIETLLQEEFHEWLWSLYFVLKSEFSGSDPAIRLEIQNSLGRFLSEHKIPFLQPKSGMDLASLIFPRGADCPDRALNAIFHFVSQLDLALQATVFLPRNIRAGSEIHSLIVSRLSQMPRRNLKLFHDSPLIKIPEYACVGCDPRRADGHQLAPKKDETTAGKVWDEVRVGGKYEGFPGILHGGVITTLLDEIMAHAILLHKGNFAYTGRLNVTFKIPVKVDEVIRLEAQIDLSSLKESRKVTRVTSAGLSLAGETLFTGEGMFFDVRAQ